jgi:hypothetical protein
MIHRVESRPVAVSPPLLKGRQLLSEEQIFGCNCAATPDADAYKANEIEHNDQRRHEAVPQSDEQNQWCGHERSASHVTRRLRSARAGAEDLFCGRQRA